MGKERDAAAGTPLHCCLEEEETGTHRKLLAPSQPGSWHYRSTSTVGYFLLVPYYRFSVENSQFGLFLCVNNLLGYSKSLLTLQAEVKARLGWRSGSSEASTVGFIQHEETLIAFKPTSVITTDPCWETKFVIVLT